jgi:hypothetical protein
MILLNTNILDERFDSFVIHCQTIDTFKVLGYKVLPDLDDDTNGEGGLKTQ